MEQLKLSRKGKTLSDREKRILEKWREKWGEEKLNKDCKCGGWLKPQRHIYRSFRIFDVYKCTKCGNEIIEPSDEKYKIDGFTDGITPFRDYIFDGGYARLSRSVWASGDYVLVHESIDSIEFRVKADFHLTESMEECYPSGWRNKSTSRDSDKISTHSVKVFVELSTWEIKRAGQGYYDKNEKKDNGYPKYQFEDRELTENEKQRAKEKIELLKEAISNFREKKIKIQNRAMNILFKEV